MRNRIPSDASSVLDLVEPAQPEIQAAAEALMVPALVANDSDADWFAVATRKGILRCSQINQDGEAFAILYWHVEEKILHADMLQSVRPDKKLNFALLTSLLRDLAYRCGCRMVASRTRRKAAALQLKETGWFAESLNLYLKV